MSPMRRVTKITYSSNLVVVGHRRSPPPVASHLGRVFQKRGPSFFEAPYRHSGNTGIPDVGSPVDVPDGFWETQP